MAKLLKIMFSLVIHRLMLGEATLSSNFTRTILTEYARKACPFNNICLTDDMSPSFEPGLFVNTTRKAGCCTDCSCSESCGLSQNCCFSDLDRYNLVDRSRQECIVPTTYLIDNAGIIKFNMVVDGYPDWNNEYCGSEAMPCGQDVRATAIGALYPVFSPTSGRIYKNIQCAKCHGLGDEDVITWDAVLMCQHDMVHSDISAAFVNIFEGKMSPNCGIQFIYPGLFGDVESETCVFHREQCLNGNSFKIPDELNMTHVEVRTACTSDFWSLYFGSRLFKNIFCDMCTRQFSLVKIGRSCSSSMLNGRLAQADFTTLLDGGLINMQTKHARNTENERQNLACRLEQGKEECRRVHCPTGQVKFGDGQCQFLSKKWNNNAFVVHLQLTPRNVIPESLIRKHDLRPVSGDESNWFTSPWPKQWKIMAFLYSKTFDSQQDDYVIDYFLVRLAATLGSRSVRNAIESIQRILMREWKLFLNGSILILDQSLSPYTNFNTCILNRTTYMQNVFGNERIIPEFALNITLPLLFDFDSLLKSDVFASESIVVTRMFYCYQISLDSSEYQIDEVAKLLYIERTGRILFHGEFSLTIDQDGEYVPSICADDDELAAFSIKRPSLSIGSFVRLQNRDFLFHFMLMIVLCLTH